MRFVAVLNRDGGTLRTLDLEAFSQKMTETLTGAGHAVEIELVSGSGIVEALERAAGREGVDVVLAGGGDGTISAAAAVLMGRSTALAILPAGTMNLFARSLGIPLDLDQALAALAKGRKSAVDMASMNGVPYVHQYSAGMHPRMIHLRKAMKFNSRLGKIGASMLAAYAAIANPPRMQAQLRLDGGEELVRRASAIGISNNLFGEGHLPYADDPAGGTLGIYITIARRKGDLIRLLFGLMLGRWQANQQVEMLQAREARLRIDRMRGSRHAALDGELIDFEADVSIRIHPGALNVLLPG